MEHEEEESPLFQVKSEDYIAVK